MERLPGYLQGIIFDLLDYQSLIRLSTMNRHFNRMVDPQRMATTDDKMEFIMRAAREFPQHRPSVKRGNEKPGNFECYVCFRVRSPEHFAMIQPRYAFVDTHGHLVTDRSPIAGIDIQISLRRFCIDCGVLEGLHAPFDAITTHTGLESWVCRCRRMWRNTECLQCPDCRSNCPLRPKQKW